MREQEKRRTVPENIHFSGTVLVHMLDCRERTEEEQREQIGAERPVMTGCCCLRGLYTLGGLWDSPGGLLD